MDKVRTEVQNQGNSSTPRSDFILSLLEWAFAGKLGSTARRLVELRDESEELGRADAS